MLIILKFLAFVGITIFGLYGSWVDTRDRTTGKITKKGWLGIFGVIFFAITVGVIQIYEDQKAEETSVNLIKKSSLILNDINRSLHPLIGLTAEYKLRPDWKHPRLKSHLEEFKARHSEPTIFGSLKYLHFNNPQAIHPSIPPFRTPFGEMEISLPVFIQSLELDQSVCNMNLILFFFKTPIDAEKFRYIGPGNKSNEDLKIELLNPCKSDLMFLPINKSLESSKRITTNIRYEMDYYMDSGKVRYLDFSVSQFKIDPTSESWRSNSKISSIFDILDAQMIVQLESSGLPIHPELSKKEIENLRKAVKISELVLRIPNGIVLSFDNDNLNEHVGEKGYRYYSFNFPDNLEEMLRATEYNMFKNSPDPNIPHTP